MSPRFIAASDARSRRVASSEGVSSIGCSIDLPKVSELLGGFEKDIHFISEGGGGFKERGFGVSENSLKPVPSHF